MLRGTLLRITAAWLVFIVMLQGAVAAGADGSIPKRHAISFFAGQATWASFTPSIYEPWNNDYTPIGVLALAYSYRLGSANSITGLALPAVIGNHVYIEGEAGTSVRLGDEHLMEGWGAAYLRFDDFPWNDIIYTTVAVNTGVSFLNKDSQFEQKRDSSKGSQLLHYMGPEITFASPNNKNLELLVRWHHRSGVFGLFDGVYAGSTFVAGGVRFRM